MRSPIQILNNINIALRCFHIGNIAHALKIPYINNNNNSILGHSGPVTCMAVPHQSQYLLTGSEDTCVILWDMKALEMKLRVRWVFSLLFFFPSFLQLTMGRQINWAKLSPHPIDPVPSLRRMSIHFDWKSIKRILKQRLFHSNSN